jgi:hypothetical protein
MIHSQKYRYCGKKFLGRLIPMLVVLAFLAILSFTIPSSAIAFGSNQSSSPRLGTPPVANAGWQADQLGREGAWWKAGRGGRVPSTTALPQGPWVPWPYSSTGPR